jgi:hypothetical protein
VDIDIIYRCCELETGTKPKRSCRPHWFSKEKCLNNLLKIFNNKVRIHAIHDGPCGPLFDILKNNNVLIDKINYCDNDKSLRYNLNYAKNIVKTDILYFLEDDYYHTIDALETLIEGFNISASINKENVITLYDAMDRYTRSDDIDYHKTLIKLGSTRYWRTAESTTCTWAISQDLYNSKVYNEAIKFGLNDRELFRYLRSQNIVLFTPMVGASTHCHEPFVSPFINWENQ